MDRQHYTSNILSSAFATPLFPVMGEDIGGEYDLIKEENGVCIQWQNDGSPSILIRLSPEKTLLQVTSSPHTVISRSYPLFAYRSLVHDLAETFVTLEQRTPPHEGPGKRVFDEKVRQTNAQLGEDFYPHWRRMLSRVPEDYLNVSKAIFAATLSRHRPGCESWPELYEHSYLVQDIQRYRAAAIACHNGPRMAIDLGEYELLHDNESHFTQFHQRFFPDDPFAPRGFDQDNTEHRRALLELLSRDWKQFYSHREAPGRSLRRTLMHLPGNIPADLFKRFHLVEPLLKRPVTDRVELLTLLLYAKTARAAHAGSWEAAFFAKATRQEILAALHHLECYYSRRLKPFTYDLRLLVSAIVKYCQAADREGRVIPAKNGTLAGLSGRSVDWLRTPPSAREAMCQQALKEGTARTALPPIPLPKSPDIRFLSTAHALSEEAKKMDHCIDQYASKAVNGQCFLFHVSYRDAEASVEVDRNGEVVQSRGPHDHANVATEYAREKLAAWGRGMRRHSWKEGMTA